MNLAHTGGHGGRPYEGSRLIETSGRSYDQFRKIQKPIPGNFKAKDP